MRKPLLLPWAFCLLLTLQTTLSTNFDNDLTFDEQPALLGEKSQESTLTSLYGHVKNAVIRVKRQFFGLDIFKNEEETTTTTSEPETTTVHTRTTRDIGYGTGVDEEDGDDVIGSGDIGSGLNGPSLTFGLSTPAKQKKFIDRAIFFIQEFWRDDLEDKSSDLYSQLKSSLESGLSRLLETEPVSGTQTADLVGMASTKERDVVKVTVDIYTQYTNDRDVSEQIKNALEKEFNEKSKIGDVVVKHNEQYPLTIRSFGERDVDLELGCSNGILCNDQTCIPIEYRCDGVPQCSDSYDENDCPSNRDNENPVKNCRGDDATQCEDKSAFICADQICDGNKDCDDGSDESNCTKNCLQREFMCDVKRCIPSIYRCDGIEHCRDKTDEQNCPKKVCGPNEYQCLNTSICIWEGDKCNRVPDCPKGDDEQGCHIHEAIFCPINKFTCESGICVSIEKRCDGIIHCPDGSDEDDCSCNPEEQFMCEDGSCIDIDKRCNSISDCSDGSDERESICAVHNCTGFECENKECISSSYRCDGHIQCKDQSDEKNCTYKNGFYCKDSNVSIHPRYRCDKNKECDDGSDEFNCTEGCSEDDFKCDDGRCIPSHKHCNRVSDCTYGEDERGCEDTECFNTEFRCRNGGCIVKEYVCDNVTDCIDKSDEEDCPAHCGPDDFRCQDGQKCVKMMKKCDGVFDCRDTSDEYGCKDCDWSEFKCGNDRCIPNDRRCNGNNDCGDNTDETDCPTRPPWTPRPPPPPPPPPSCPRGQFLCHSGNQCISETLLCDRTDDCQDGSDERNCNDIYTPCRSGEFACRTGQQCVSSRAICDGVNDCLDRSDEENCIGPGGLPAIKLVTTPQQLTIKQGEEVVFQCRDTGDGRYPVQWTRGNGKLMPRNARYTGSRLEIPNIQMGDDGTYICEAIGVPHSTPGSRVNVYLQVIPSNMTDLTNSYSWKYGVLTEKEYDFYGSDSRPTSPPRQSSCRINEATCSNGQCINKNKVCNGIYDCDDQTDEYRCSNPVTKLCEPNQYKCDSEECVIKSWWCDGQLDCRDGSDEKRCSRSKNGTCYIWEFQCESDQFCIPSAFRCDNSPECKDGSDEIGCYKVRFVEPYIPLSKELREGETLTLECTATGVPTPRISWRRNWMHVPKKCTETSINGHGILICPNIRPEDSGAYSCEAIQKNIPDVYPQDTKVIVNPDRPFTCRPGTFNNNARRQEECITCFCFGQAQECSSANLFVYQLPPPKYNYRLVPVRKIEQNYEIDMLETSPIQRYVQPGQDGFKIQAPNGARDSEEIYQYYALPDTYHSNQLNSYGGYIKYKLNASHDESWKPYLTIPDVIIQGNNKLLLSQPFIAASRNSIEQDVSIRIFEGDWRILDKNDYRERQASRVDIMMVLENVENVLIRVQYFEGPAITTSLTNIHMDSASVIDYRQGRADFVEQCSCPQGYQGQSCEKCLPGFRREVGAYLGTCSIDIDCPPGTYGAPDRRIPCSPCPCPLTYGGNQFAQTCRLDSIGVVCDCPEGYVGSRCERCDIGYTGNPIIPGSYCTREEQCSLEGSLSTRPDSSGRCECKQFSTGDRCDQCKPNTFNPGTIVPGGCTPCFCMGVTQECRASDLYRDEIKSIFIRNDTGFKIAPLSDPEQKIDVLVQDGKLIFDNFDQEIYYWVLPQIYLDDKVTSYGGVLKYTINYVPFPGGQSSKNNAADVVIKSTNGIKLSHFSKFKIDQSRDVNLIVDLIESSWQRDDGGVADRETFLMALSDIQSIYIKATYTTNTYSAALISISMDTATNRNTGLNRAQAVEDCICPQGYIGTSCEDCAPGFARTTDGIYLGLCEPCDCNGFSDECDPVSGECVDCKDNRQGNRCQECIPGYTMQNNICIFDGGQCNCDKRGNASDSCYDGRCSCKINVVGDRCSECRSGTYHLSEDNEFGCTECYCFGQTSECRSSGYTYSPIPITILDENHGFTLSDGQRSIRENLIPNYQMSEIGFRVEPSQKRFWSLPSSVLGDQILSYAGELSFTVRFTSSNDESIHYGDRAVILSGNGMTIYHSVNYDIRPAETRVISVKLDEKNFKMLNPRAGNRPVAKNQMLQILSKIDSILVEVVSGVDTDYSYISDVTLERAGRVDGRPAPLVEICTCPPGFRGTSCQDCIEGYYKDYRNRCKPCPCENGGRCRIRSDYQFTCECEGDWTGERCEQRVPDRRPPPPDGDSQKKTIELQISGGRSNETVQTGGTIRLECYGSSKQGRVSVVWSKIDGVLPPSRTVEDRNGILIISDATASDSGIYTCTGHDGYTSHTISITIVVVGRDDTPLISIEPEYISVMVGEPIEILCSARRGSKASIDWRRLDTDGSLLPLNPQIVIVDGRLSIPSARTEDQGMYECTATNNAGFNVETVVVEVKHVVDEPPIEFNIEPKDMSVSSGSTVKITCAISNYDKSILLKWKRERRPININHQVTINGPTAELLLKDVTPADSGTYICTGTKNNRVIGQGLAYISVIDSPAPRVSIRPSQITVNVNDIIRLECYTGSSARIVWSKSGSELSPRAQIRDGNRTLIIQQAQKSDTGIYVCDADLYGSRGKGTAMVQVEQTIVPTIDIRPSGSLSLRSSQTHYIQCRGTGYPEPRVYWSRQNGNSLPYNMRDDRGTLTISGMTLEAEGIYICTAENRGGKVTGDIYVTLHGKPKIRMNYIGNVTLTLGERFDLECIGDGNPTPSVILKKPPRSTNYIYEAVPEASSIGRATYNIISISEDDAGDYVCTAENIHGRTTESVKVYIEGISVPRPGGDQIDDSTDYQQKGIQKHEILEGTDNNFRCKFFDDYTGPDYMVEWVRSDGRSLPANVYQRDGELYFTNTRSDMEGNYACQLKGRSGSVIRQSTTKFVVKRLKQVILDPVRQVVRVGDNARIECRIEGEPRATIKWSAVNRTLPESTRISHNTIYFENMQESDAGEYLCVAEMPGYTGRSKAKVVIGADPGSYNRKIVNLVGEKIRNVTEGGSIRVQCTTDRQGEIVSWSKANDQPLPSTAIIIDNMLIIDDILHKDAGTYYCSVVTRPDRETGWDSVTINVWKVCNYWEKQCPDGKCAPYQGNCPTNSDLYRNKREHDVLTTNIKDDESVIPMLRIEPSIDLVRVGDEIDLKCVTTGLVKDPKWEILNDNEQARQSTKILGRVIRISKVYPMHAGRYRCFAKTQSGQDIENTYTLVVQDDGNQRKAAKTKRAIVGETVVLECDQGLEPPTTFTWIKGQGKAIPNAKNHTLIIEKVTQSDAGEYICIASNSAVKIDFPTFLIIKGTIPKFKNSYIKLKGLPQSSYLRTELHLMVKPETDGLILYTSDKKSRDFVSFGIRNGHPEFRFDVGSGEAIIVSNMSLPMGQWSNVTLKRERREGKMWINGRGPVVGTSIGRFQGLDLSEPVYIGSVPNFTDIKPAAGFTNGFQGCISHFKIGDMVESLAQKDTLEWNNVNECETCRDDICHNNGVCQEDPNYRGYKCMCPRGFTGNDCEKMGTTCYDGLCGDGNCENLEYTFRCHCKLGSYGQNCEHHIQITVPMFKHHSHLAYAVPISGNKFLIEIDIKPEENNGIIFYAGQKEYISLSIKDNFIYLTLDLGLEPTVLESRDRVEFGQWSNVVVEKIQDRISLTVNGATVNAIVAQNGKTSTMNTIYIGGYDRLSVHPIGKENGFNGCTRSVSINKRHLGLTQALIGSSNVHQCKGEMPNNHLKQIIGDEEPCPAKPCKNGGICNRHNDRQFCVCNEFFQGDYCESETPCKMDHFCRPHGECKTYNDGTPNSPGFKCHCHFGYTGTYCNEAVHITTDAEFNKHSYIELSESLLPGGDDKKTVSFMLQTTSPRGLVFWQGREQHTREQEYFSIAVMNGHVETIVHDDSGSMKLRSRHRVDDDRPHNITIIRYPGEVQMTVDTITEATASGGITTPNDSPGNIFIGGMPDIEFNTGGKFEIGFEGCIASVRIDGKSPINFQEVQIDSRNISPCSSFDWMPSSLVFTKKPEAPTPPMPPPGGSNVSVSSFVLLTLTILNLIF